ADHFAGRLLKGLRVGCCPWGTGRGLADGSGRTNPARDDRRCHPRRHRDIGPRLGSREGLFEPPGGCLAFVHLWGVTTRCIKSPTEEGKERCMVKRRMMEASGFDKWGDNERGDANPRRRERATKICGIRRRGCP